MHRRSLAPLARAALLWALDNGIDCDHQWPAVGARYRPNGADAASAWTLMNADYANDLRAKENNTGQWRERRR